MNEDQRTRDELLKENEELRKKLSEANAANVAKETFWNYSARNCSKGIRAFSTISPLYRI